MYLVYIIYYSFCDLGEEVFVKRYLLLRCGSLFFLGGGGGVEHFWGRAIIEGVLQISVFYFIHFISYNIYATITLFRTSCLNHLF